MGTTAFFEADHRPNSSETGAVADLLINQVAHYNTSIHQDLLDPHDALALDAKRRLETLLGVASWLETCSGKRLINESPASAFIAELTELTTRRFGVDSLTPVDPVTAVRVLVDTHDVIFTTPHQRFSTERWSQIAKAVRALRMLGFDSSKAMASNKTLLGATNRVLWM